MLYTNKEAEEQDHAVRNENAEISKGSNRRDADIYEDFKTKPIIGTIPTCQLYDGLVIY